MASVSGWVEMGRPQRWNSPTYLESRSNGTLASRVQSSADYVRSQPSIHSWSLRKRSGRWNGVGSGPLTLVSLAELLKSREQFLRCVFRQQRRASDDRVWVVRDHPGSSSSSKRTPASRVLQSTRTRALLPSATTTRPSASSSTNERVRTSSRTATPAASTTKRPASTGSAHVTTILKWAAGSRRTPSGSWAEIQTSTPTWARTRSTARTPPA